MAKKTTKKAATEKKNVKMDRRNNPERRESDRRQQTTEVAVDRRQGERRVQRRRQIDPTTCERDYSGDEIEFMRAMDEYKRASGRMFPTCSEILEVIRSLGYIRPEGAEPISPEEAAILAASGAASENNSTEIDEETSLT